MKVASHLLKTHLPLHTWCGVVSALFLIVCFLAGALTLFLDDLNRWAAPPPPSVMPAPDARQQAQLLLRLGYAAPLPYAKRKPVEAVIREAS